MPSETALPTLRRHALLDCDPATARAVFVDRIGDWWPFVGF
ncbi:hypothetical protein [Brevibacterium litoralis]